MAKGTYPTAQAGAPRESTFRLRSNLALYGGFAGDETAVEHRHLSLNETVLTGDIDLDDPEFSDCCIGNDSPSCDDAICSGTVCLWIRFARRRHAPFAAASAATAVTTAFTS